MAKSLIVLYLKGKMYNLDLDNIQSLLDVNRILDNSRLPFDEQLVIPFRSEKDGYVVVASNICKVEINGQTIVKDTNIKHNELIKITFDELQYEIRFISQYNLVLSTKAYNLSADSAYINCAEDKVSFTNLDSDSAAIIEKKDNMHYITSLSDHSVYINDVKTKNALVTSFDVIHINGTTFSIIGDLVFLPSSVVVEGVTRVKNFGKNDIII